MPFLILSNFLSLRSKAKAEFDTLGFTASQVAKRHAEEAKAGTIPGPAPSELIMPFGDSMGRKLLRTMGWREGQGVGRRKTRRRQNDDVMTQGDDSSGEELSEQARAGLGEKAKALIEREGLTFAPDNAAIGPQVIVPRSTYHGVGYEPFRNMPEFSSARVALCHTPSTRSVLRTKDILRKSEGGDEVRTSSELESSLCRGITRGTHGFALDDEEDDVYDLGGKDVFYQSPIEEIARPGIDSGLVRSAREWASNTVDGEGEPPSSHRSARCPSDGRLPPAGFFVAQLEEGRYQFWAPPKPPEDFHPVHKFEDLESPESIKGKRFDMDSSRRSELLGEPNREVGHDLFTGVSKSVKGLPENSKDESVFSLLTSSARQKLAEATRSLGDPSIGISMMNQSLETASKNDEEATRAGFQVGLNDEAGLRSNRQKHFQSLSYWIWGILSSNRSHIVNADSILHRSMLRFKKCLTTVNLEI